MGCSNARLLVQAPLNNEPVPTGNPSTSPQSLVTESHNTNTTNATTTRMHLTGVDLVVERNGSYTLLLTPKTHKQLMPYVLRKKRFRILVDKNRTGISADENDKPMETNIDTTKLTNDEQVLEQMATDEYERTERRILGGRSIDRGNPEDDEANIESDDEGMIEEIITTVEEDKDLECKVKTKIETKKTIAQDPETHNKITKVVKTEVKEVTRTITINDSHDLERAKRELGIDDVNRYLPPTSTWNIETTRSIENKENQSGTTTNNESIPIQLTTEKSSLAEATSVGRGAVIETISSIPNPSITNETKKKKKKKKSKFCSCTKSVVDDEEKNVKPSSVNIAEDKTKMKTTEEFSQVSTSPPVVQTTMPTKTQGQTLISSDIKQLIIDKKQLLIDYIHSTVFSPAKLVETDEENLKARKISSRILDLLRYDRCSSWSQMLEKLEEEYLHPSSISRILSPMIQTYENLFTQNSSQLLNTFSTIHQANDLTNIVENHDYLTVVQTSLNDRQASADDHHSNATNDEKEINNDLLSRPSKDEQTIYDEEQMSKMLADLQIHKPITLAEAIAYQYIDIEDPKLALSYDTVQRIKNLFRPLNEENLSNIIRVKRSGELLADVNLVEMNPFEKFNELDPLIYQLQTSFEPTLDFNEKQFRNLTETILNHKDQYDQFEFDIARTVLPLNDLKESSTNDFSQSDSGYSMTTATYESLASKIKIEFEPINQEIIGTTKTEDLHEEEKIDLDQISAEKLAELRLTPELIQIIKSDFDGTDKTVGQAILSRELPLDAKNSHELKAFGIGEEEAMILSEFFFPKQTRIIAYSPSPGRFVEAQTTYHPDLPTHQIDTTIIQIQEKQLSADPLTMQRSIPDDRTPVISSKTMQESSDVTSLNIVKKEKTPPSTPIYIKKRKSTSSAGLLSCFRSKKPKAASEQQGQPTIAAPVIVETPTTTNVTVVTTKKAPIDYAILPDGRRIYIDAFRDRPGMDMSYEPTDFHQRFVLPQTKSSNDYERSMTPDTESTVLKSEVIEEKIQLSQSETVEEKSEMIDKQSTSVEVHQENIEQESSDVPLPEVKIEQEATSIPVPEPETTLVTAPEVKVEIESKPISLVQTKVEEIPTEKKTTLELHGASVNLPEVALVEPGPLPRLSLSKRKKSDEKSKKMTGGLCASCFGGKSSAKRKKESISAPIEAKVPIIEEKHDVESSPAPAPVTAAAVVVQDQEKIDMPILPRVNIDVYRERNFDKTAEDVTKKSEPTFIPSTESAFTTVVAKTTPTIEKNDFTSIFSNANIDNFRERDFQTGLIVKTNEDIVEEEKPNVTTVVVDVEPPPKEVSPVRHVNIDTFRERNFNQTIENLPEVQVEDVPKAEEIPLETPIVIEEALAELPAEPEALPVEETKEISPESEPSRTPTPPPPAPVEISETIEISPVVEEVQVEVVEESHYEVPTHDEVSIESEVPIGNEVQHYEVPVQHEAPPSPSAPPSPPSPSPPSPSTPLATQNKDENSIYSKVNIDVFRERTYPITNEKPKKVVQAVVEEPHYQEPVQTVVSKIDETSIYSRVNIDVFRERDFPLVTEKPVKKIEASSSSTTYDVPRSVVEPSTNTSIDLVPISSIEKTTIPQIEQVKETMVESTSTKSKDKPKKKTKSKFFTKFFRTRAPALNLPSVDQSIVLQNVPRPPHRRESDPLYIPNLNLPQPNIQLPNYDRPEVNMKTGQLPNKDEFAVPTVQLPIIQDLNLPQTDNKPVQVSIDEMKVPQTNLPDVQYQTTIVETVELPPPLPKLQPLTIEEKYSITTTRFVETNESPLIDDKTKRSAEFQFELPPTEPVPTLTKSSMAVPPSFDDDVPSAPSKIVPAVEYSSPSTSKTIEVKKSSTFPLCSCFGRKSSSTTTNETRPQTRTIVVPKTDLPPVDFSPPSSNVSQLMKTNENLRAPKADLPAIDLSAKETEVVRLPTLSSFRSNEDKPVESIQSVPSSDVNKQINIISSRSDSGLGTQSSLSAQTHVDQWTRLKTILIEEISKTSSSSDRKSTEKLVEHAVDLIKEKKVENFNELKDKLSTEEKTTHVHLIDPIVRSLRYTIEKQGLDNIDKPEFPLAISDLVRSPVSSTSDAVVSLGTTNMPKNETKIERKSSSIESSSRTCFSCNRSKKSTSTTTNDVVDGLLDERRRTQLHEHRQELAETILNQIQSNQPTIQRCVDHPKETEKILRKALVVVGQNKTHSYEQIRHEFKSEYKQTFDLVDPIVDIIRDTIDHCDLSQMNSKTNLDILKSHISQSAQLYNNENPLLNADEHRNLKSNQLSWLEYFLVEQETKEKKLHRKQQKEFQRILHRTLEIFSLNNVSTWEELALQLHREYPKSKEIIDRLVQVVRQSHRDGHFLLQQAPTTNDSNKRRPSMLITERAKDNLKTNRNKVFLSMKKFFEKSIGNHHDEFDEYLKKTFEYLEEHKPGQFKDYNDLKDQLKKDFPLKNENHRLIEQLVDVVEQAHACNQFEDIDKAEVQALMLDRLNGKPLVIKEMYVSLPSRLGAHGSLKNSTDDSTNVNGERTLNNGNNRYVSHRVGRGLSWREANERARILFYRGKHPAIHYDEQSAAFDVRMLLETASGGTQEIPVTDSDVHELLNSCGVQWDGVNFISLLDRSEDVVRAAEQAALKVIREKGLVDLRTPLTNSHDNKPIDTQGTTIQLTSS